ncbi:hypothetical protein L211DRAFT_578221 [Terfezia boudieri ATCC MYA-4762]|uniref:Uncharacterized protein n=1 Tax=Terfezia boudieri ATCC MYA-4762 TaxID=1051890 RepID=A0A3N4LH66_9PEZI|nr:hypothetical protein L211DRAFT_578221 [Terfezia boudieri ATCC MYA-4762]
MPPWGTLPRFFPPQTTQQDDTLSDLLSKTCNGLHPLRNILTEQGQNTDRWDFYTIGIFTGIQLDIKLALSGVPPEFREGSNRYEKEFLRLHSPPSPSPVPVSNTATQTIPPITPTRNSVSTTTDPSTATPPEHTYTEAATSTIGECPSNPG